MTQAGLGQVFVAQGEEVAGIAEMEAAAGSLRALLAEEPSNATIRTELLVTIGLTGELIEDMGDLERARRAYDETLKIGAELLARDESNARARANQTAGFSRVALLLHRLGEIAEALAYVNRAIDTLRPLAARDAQYAETMHWLEQVVLVEFTTSLALVEGRQEPAGSLEHADLARTLLRRRDYARASDEFALALQDARIREDLGNLQLLNATRAAARASEAGGDRAEVHRQRALEWLSAEVAARRARIEQLAVALDGTKDESERTPLLGERRRHQRMLEAMRRDVDLVSLTGPGGVEALLGAPTPR